jgi:transcriptional regulator with XRE-family HTH domain
MRLRELRLERGWSQDDLADRAGLRKALISELETGKGNPTVGTLQRIATGLGVSVREMLREDADPVVAEIVALLRRLSPEERAAVLMLLRARR